MIDIFLSHAGEDKVSVARPLYRLLKLRGYSVWLDEAELKLGDSIFTKITEGLSLCRFGVVIVSPSFLRKNWPKRELEALFTREELGDKIILPVWHEVDFSDVVKASPILAGRLAVKTVDGLDKVVGSIASAVGDSNELQGGDIPNELIIEMYSDACEGEELYLEFCRDVVEEGDFLKNVSRSLRQGGVDGDKARRITENLSHLLLQLHLRFLFELVCLTYDKVPISDDVLRRMINRGLTKSEIIDASNYIPKSASTYFSRLIFDAFYKLGVSPVRFESAIFSPAFMKYCLQLDFERTKEIMESWSQKFDFGVVMEDATACILYMLEHTESEDAKHRVSQVLRGWYKRGIVAELSEETLFKVRQAIW